MHNDPSALLWFLADLSLRAGAVALAAAGVLKVLDVRAATVRHTVWTIVLAAMLLMPVLPSIIPALPLPALARIATAPVPERSGALGPLGVHRSTAATPGAVVAPLAAMAPAVVEPVFKASRPSRRDWPAFAIAAVYAVGVTFFLARLVLGWRIISRVVRRTRSADIDGPVYESSEVVAPLTVGIIHPVVVLPATWRTWKDDVRAAVIAHEMAHVQRRDALVALVARVNRAAFWFHPLAWWLERQLAVTAEHACDEIAARAVAQPRRYAEILVDMAATVSRTGGRLAWPAVGVDGAGSLEARIDRVLDGRFAQTSRARTWAALAITAGAILLVVACRQQVPELKQDPAFSKQLAEEDQRMKKFETVRKLTPADVAALEQRIAANPQDFDTRERLVWYYSTSLDVAWEQKVPGLRRHALWLIEHAPEHDLAAPSLSAKYDQEGFAAAKKLWEAHLARADASPFLVYRAARFFAPHDKPTAETLVLRGLAMDPESKALDARLGSRYGGFSWRSQLADLYASALLGSEGVWGTYNDLRTHVDRVESPYAVGVRQKLEATNDAQLLARVGERLTRPFGRPDDKAITQIRESARALGIQYLQRAVQIDPQNVTARTVLYRATAHRQMNEADRLANKAHERFMISEDITEYAKKDPDTAKKERDDAKRDAERVLEMARTHPGDPAYSGAVMTAHHVLAALALREGDRERSIRHLHESVKVPTSEQIQYAPPFSWSRPVHRLLKAGERERIVAFLEAYAQLTVSDRQRLLDDAKAIREGLMPRGYQQMLNREWNDKHNQESRSTIIGSVFPADSAGKYDASSAAVTIASAVAPNTIGS